MNVFREQKQFVDNRPVCDTRGNTTWVVRSLPHTMCDESNGGAGPHMVVGASRSSGSHMVGFQPQRTEQYREQRTKFLTMRYGAHQMKLVRKRLKVEEWLDNELRSLYGCVSETDDYETEIDLDEVLNYDTDDERRAFILSKIGNCTQPPHAKRHFVDCVLQKLSEL